MASDKELDKILEEIGKSKVKISESDYTDVDALIFAEISGINIDDLGIENCFSYNSDNNGAVYNDWNVDYTPAELVALYEQKYSAEKLKDNDKYKILKCLAESERYREIKISHFVHTGDRVYIDENGDEYNANYKAVTVDLGDTKVIAYAGTGGSIFSWFEDGRIASAGEGIGAQVWGKEYAEFVMNLDSDSIMFGGYSKGGNQAIYSAIYLSEAYGDRIKKVINVDGPGFGEKALQSDVNGKTFLEVWNELCEKGVIASTTTPHESMVGSLLADHKNYKYIQQDCWLFLLGHDFVHWNVMLDEKGAPVFVESKVQERAEVSEKLETLVNGIFEEVSTEEFGKFVNVLTDFCVAYEISTLGDFEEKLLSLNAEEFTEKFIEFYREELTDAEKEAFNKVLTALAKNENAEEFMIAWRKQLIETGNEEALKLADTLQYYPIFTALLENLSIEDFLLASKIVDGYCERIGGVEAFQKMDGTEITLSVIEYFYSLPLSEQRYIIKTLGDMNYDAVDNFLTQKGLLWSIGFKVFHALQFGNLERVTRILMDIVVGLAVIVCLAIEFGEAIYEAYEFVKAKITEFMKKMIAAIEDAINRLKNWISEILQKIGETVAKTVESAKYVVKDQVIKFSTVWSLTFPNPVLKLSGIITYALKSAYTSAHIHVEFDLQKLRNLVERLSAVVSKAGSLESELDSFYSYLKHTKVKIDDKKEITLAKKYGIGKRDLDPDKAGTLKGALNRLDDAYNKLYRLDGTLLS